MRTTIPDDGAYPSSIRQNYESGLTKREYFAAMALQGLIVKYGTAYSDNMAVICADDLIKELNKENDE